MITLKKIAELANVSVSTVSRALNDAFDVSPHTREHILKIAKENGYFSEKSVFAMKIARKAAFK